MKQSIFGQNLKQAIERAGLSPHSVAVQSGINSSNLYNMLSGRRRPSDSDLEKLAAVEPLRTSLDELKTWADLDLLGPDGIQRLMRNAPEILFPITSPEVRYKVLRDELDAAIPPTEEERELLKALEEMSYYLETMDMPEFWKIPPEKRSKSFDYARNAVKHRSEMEKLEEQIRAGVIPKDDQGWAEIIQTELDIEKIGGNFADRLRKYADELLRLKFYNMAERVDEINDTRSRIYRITENECEVLGLIEDLGLWKHVDENIFVEKNEIERVDAMNELLSLARNELMLKNTKTVREVRKTMSGAGKALLASTEPYPAWVSRPPIDLPFGDDKRYPATEVERKLIQEAEALNVWANEIEYPNFFDHTPEQRAKTFEYLQELVDAAKKFYQSKSGSHGTTPKSERS